MVSNPLCWKCDEEITDRNQMISFGRKIQHFHCPRDVRQDEWDKLMDQVSRGEL
jgi:hypothetical protein